MSINRLFTLLVVIALMAVITLTVREAFAGNGETLQGFAQKQASGEYFLGERDGKTLQTSLFQPADLSSYSSQTYRIFLRAEWFYCTYTSNMPQPICRS